jgi:protein phosphatase
VAHVGDSRLYRIQPDEILQITEDHTKVQEMVQKDILTPEEARKHPQKNIITRCVGRNRRLKPDIFATDFTNGDIFLICSDGLNDMIEDDEIHRIVVESDSLGTAVDGLVELANENGGKDNITVVLFRLDSVSQ